MSYLIVFVFAFWIGGKVQKAIGVYKDVRNVKLVEKSVKQILDKNSKVSVIRDPEDPEESDYIEFLKFKNKFKEVPTND